MNYLSQTYYITSESHLHYKNDTGAPSRLYYMSDALYRSKQQLNSSRLKCEIHGLLYLLVKQASDECVNCASSRLGLYL